MDAYSPDRYEELVLKSGLADYSDTRGCMIIRPYGYAIWELIKAALDAEIRATGHQNAYFPMLIPKSALEREAAHVAEFAKQCAVVTHYRLKRDEAGGGLIVDPDAKLAEELIVRPTSEAVIWPAFARWIKSYRDLPLLINHWANIVRWEIRTKLFLRTAEFLWQECHTAHATEAEARHETGAMLQMLSSFINRMLAIPTITGIKTDSERFAGAEATYTVEVLLQDGKALQAATSHYFGQNFSKAYGVQFATRNGSLEYAWGTTWGCTTRLIGAVVQTHSDARGLMLPPAIAPVQIVIIPVLKKGQEPARIDAVANNLLAALHKAGIRASYDNDPGVRPGRKYAQYELQGVPLRAVIGARELENNLVEIVRRDGAPGISCLPDALPRLLPGLLEEIQKAMYTRAKTFLDTHTRVAESYEHFGQLIHEKAGMVLAHWDGTAETEAAVKRETGATIRCIPLQGDPGSGSCIYSGQPSAHMVYFAKSH